MKPILVNFHMHSTGSDGRMTPKEVVKEAITGNIKYMCFTDHYNSPKGNADIWEKDKRFSKKYLTEIKRLQEEYKEKIDISLGVELDWFEEYEEWAKSEILKYKFDYVIGSIHLLPLGSRYFPVEFGAEGKQKFLEVIEKFGGIKKIVQEYYRQIALLAKSKLFDTVGHFDLIKMYNSDSSLFSEEDSWYKEAVKKALDAIAASSTCLEINVHGLIKATKAQYPSLWILKEARKRNIPITVGTDAHGTGQIIRDLDKAYDFAKEAGYKEIQRFKARKRFPVQI